VSSHFKSKKCLLFLVGSVLYSYVAWNRDNSYPMLSDSNAFNPLTVRLNILRLCDRIVA